MGGIDGRETLFRFVFIDVDGTLLNSRHRISSRTRRAIARGIRVILASARMPDAMLPLVRELGRKTPVISYNGAYVWEPTPEVFPGRSSTTGSPPPWCAGFCGRVRDPASRARSAAKIAGT